MKFFKKYLRTTLVVMRGLSIVISLAAPLNLLYAQTELVLNGGFELPSDGINVPDWTLGGGASLNTFPGSWIYAHTGTNYLLLGGAEKEQDYTYQVLYLPSTIEAATLSFYYNIDSTDGTTVPSDTFSCAIRGMSGTLLDTVTNLSNINQDPGKGNPYYH